MKIAVCGASGNFGSAVVKSLLEKMPADTLILISRDPAKLKRHSDKGCDVRFGDFDDRSSMERALEGANRVLMISGTRVGFREPQHTNVIEAAKTVGVEHIIYTSFIGADSENPSMAVKDHIFTEAYLRASGIDWTFLRNAQYSDAVLEAMGPLALSSKTMHCVAGDGKMAFVCRHDCVAAAVAILTSDGHKGKTYQITGPELLSFRDVSDLLQALMHVDIEFKQISEEELYGIFDSLGIPRQPVDNLVVNNFPWNSDDMVSFEVAIRDGHFAIISDDVENLTGRKPESLSSFLRRNVEALNAAKNNIQLQSM